MSVSNNLHIVHFRARDGVLLGGTYFPAATTSDKLPVLICCGTGITQKFYAPFAQWLNEQGHTVFTFDYRGIGASVGVKDIRQSQAYLHDWGISDMPAALDWLLQKTAAPKAFLLGHSAGGCLAGLMHNHAHIARLVAVSSSTGYIGNMPLRFRVFATLFLGIYAPVTALFLGYAPAKRIGWGEDLPKQIALQWRRWCRRPGYVKNDFGTFIQQHFYDGFRSPITLMTATDDPICPLANRTQLLALYSQADSRYIALNPDSFQLQKIGHVDMFRTQYAAIWPHLLAELTY